MPYLPTPQAFLEQSALLLEAYPDTTRITTKYSFPSHKPKSTSTVDSASADPKSQPPATTPVATLTLKTYNPSAGLCLKYRTNKAAEVGRLITSLGKLAAGADVASLGLSGAAPGTQVAADVEMMDAPEEGASTPTPAAASMGKTDSGSKGGRSKKKGGKGKR
ncbi:hypothetical protein EYZ11_002368 [Aspergillus tanneri]|nr:hypothetical protein EYZ11_002368 [Aspergillus tanneri]